MHFPKCISFIVLVFLLSCSSTFKVETDPLDNTKIITYETKLETVRGLLGNHYIQLVKSSKNDKNAAVKMNMKFYGYYKEKASKDYIELNIDDVMHKLPVELTESYTSASGCEKLTEEAITTYDEKRLWYTIKLTVPISAEFVEKLKGAKKLLIRVHYFNNVGEDASTFGFSQGQIENVGELLRM